MLKKREEAHGEAAGPRVSGTRTRRVFSACALAAALALATASHDAAGATLTCKTDGHWRDIAYLSNPMKNYASLKKCITWCAYQFELPEELIYSILYVERGSMTGKCRNNRNGTQDCGPAQINDVRLKELSRFGLTKSDMKNNPCENVWAMSYLLRREIEKADGNIWRGVGNYHYHYSVNRSVHERYINRIRSAWQKLVDSTLDRCMEQD